LPDAFAVAGRQNFMIDVHCHILPGLDDGSQGLSESLEMAEMAIADGITRVVATPHSSSSYSFDFRRVRECRDELQKLLGDRLLLATGCDFHMSPENMIALREDAPRFCINQKGYLLVEFNEFSIPPAMDHRLHELRLAGLRPVITHPERNAILRAHPERLKTWVRHGSFVQVTGGSLTGHFGPGAREDAWRWIGEGLVHFVASDAHNTQTRPLVLRAAYDAVEARFGKEKAVALFLENPLAAFEGQDLPHVPEVREESDEPRKKRFFFF
jgi:protein-tyrosine phosphatase